VLCGQFSPASASALPSHRPGSYDAVKPLQERIDAGRERDALFRKAFACEVGGGACDALAVA
jgi:hypothetical protein